MPFTPRWPTELRDACNYVVIELGETATVAHQRAVAGTLPQLKPGATRPDAQPDLPIGTVRDWAREAKVRRRQVQAAAAGPRELLTGTVARLNALFEREVKRAEVQAARRVIEPDRIERLAKAGLALERLSRAVSGKGGPVPEEGAKTAKPDAASAAGSFLDALAGEDT